MKNLCVYQRKRVESNTRGERNWEKLRKHEKAAVYVCVGWEKRADFSFCCKIMENYQENCNSNNQIEPIQKLHQLEAANLEHLTAAIEEKDIYSFGAQVTKIRSKQEMEKSKEEENIIEFESFPINLALIETEYAAIPTPIDSAIDIDDDLLQNNKTEAQNYAVNRSNEHEGRADSRQSTSTADDDTSTSTDSDFSDISDVSGKEWKPITRKPILWVQKQIHSGRNPRELLSRFLPAGAQSIAMGLNDMSLWRLLANMLSEPPRRQKLRHINTFEDVIQLILRSENIVVLTGAGVSVSCGIPDFRSSDGIYSRLAKDYPNLPDPQAMFDIDYFSRDPRPFYKFAREIYPGQFKPSPCHRFIKLLEEKQRLLRNYTQNIDTLEQVAGIDRVIECHGSFSTASCTKCKFKCDAEAIRADIFAQRIPACPRCQPHVQQSVDAGDPVSEYDLRLLVANGIMKPDIVFFGEGLPEEFHKVMASDKDKCDLLIVIGSSLKVRPVALIPSSLPSHVPQILINREQLNHLEFDVELLGDSDVIINQICHRLGDDWKQICYNERILSESKELRPFDNDVDDDELADSSEYIDNDEESRCLIPPDADTQSVKSNISAELGFRSVGASDSGFESSTSIGQPENVRKSIINYEIENIKSELLEFEDEAARHEHQNLMTPPAPSVCGESVRHMSIDSTKDSGIQCDTQLNEIASVQNQFTTPPTCVKRSAAAATTSNIDNRKQNSHKSRPCSAADFLIEGTYYFHKNSCSYVFPGAQISWYADESDSEIDQDEEADEVRGDDDRIRHVLDIANNDDDNDDDDDDDDDGDDDDDDEFDNKCDEGNCSQDSHEYNETFAESVSTLDNRDHEEELNSKTLTVNSHSCKRRSSGDRFYKSVEEVNTQTINETPPLKMRRTNEESVIATTTNTNINCKEDEKSLIHATTTSSDSTTITSVINVTSATTVGTETETETTTIPTGTEVLQEI